MAFTDSRVQTPIGARASTFWPITAEPANARPTYGEGIDMGANVKAYVTVQVASGSIHGDDVEQFAAEIFSGGQLDAETTLDDLEVNATLFGHTFSEEAGEQSSADDIAKDGGYSFIEQVFAKNKGTFFRATCLLKVTPMASSEKQEADTRKRGEFNPKMKVVSYKISEDNSRVWRRRKDFKTQAEAESFIKTTFGAAAGA